MSQYNPLPMMPINPNPLVQRRIEHTSLRHRMLTGRWMQDLIDTIAEHIPADRQAAWGVPDMSSNIFKAASSSLCGLYREAPTIAVRESRENQSDGLVGSEGLINRAGLWPLMQRVQFFTIGMRECFLRIDITDDGKDLLYRIVTPDFVDAESSAGDPSRPNKIKEMRLRYDEDLKKYEWTIDLLDISNPEDPKYEVYTISQNGKIDKNVTDKYLKQNFSGANYPYRDQNGVPFLPYSLYHAEIHGHLFDPFAMREVVAGALTSATMYSFFVHLARDCSHPQRWLMGAGLAGADMFDNNLASRRNAISSDPASILIFAPDPDLQSGQQPQIGQFQAGGDVGEMLEAITIYERRLATYMGINPADVQKMSGDPRSGFAIAISRSSLREAQRKFAPSFRKSDIDTLEISAKMANRFLGGSYPETGYRIEYHAIPLSPMEQKEQRENILSLLDAGLISKVDAIQILHPDLDDVDAKRMLLRIANDNLSY